QIATESGELFRVPGLNGYGRIEVDRHYETHRVQDNSYKRWLKNEFFDRTGTTPAVEVFKGSLDIIELRAQRGPEKEVFLRRGLVHNDKNESDWYVDLGNAEWQAVKIDSSRWRVVTTPKAWFRCPKGMLPLPFPERGGSLKELRPLI